MPYSDPIERTSPFVIFHEAGISPLGDKGSDIISFTLGPDEFFTGDVRIVEGPKHSGGCSLITDVTKFDSSPAAPNQNVKIEVHWWYNGWSCTDFRLFISTRTLLKPPPKDIPVQSTARPTFKKGSSTMDGDMGTLFLPGANNISEETKDARYADDKQQDKWILSIDGGAMRGIIPIYILKVLEVYYGMKTRNIFDMYSGTSTGALISTSLAKGVGDQASEETDNSLEQIFAIYQDKAMREVIFLEHTYENNKRIDEFENQQYTYTDKDNNPQTFKPRKKLQDLINGILDEKHATLLNSIIAVLITFILGIGALVVGLPPLAAALFTLSGCVLVLGVFLQYLSNGGFRDRLFDEFNNSQVKQIIASNLTPICSDLRLLVFRSIMKEAKLSDIKDKDVLIITKDMQRNEILFLSCFNNLNGQHGTFKDISIVKALMSTSAGAPFFNPVITTNSATAQLEAVTLDGGISSFNNPSFAAAIEALYFSNTTDTQPGSTTNKKLDNKNMKYEEGKTVVWSIGTSIITKKFKKDDFTPAKFSNPNISYSLEEFKNNPNLPLFWIQSIVENCFSSANDQQVFLGKKLLEGKIVYRRINIFINIDSLRNLLTPAIGSKSDDELIRMINIVDTFNTIADEDFQVVDLIGKLFAEEYWKQIMGQVLPQNRDKFNLELGKPEPDASYNVSMNKDFESILP